jgi:HK97 family phage major capsid protein
VTLQADFTAAREEIAVKRTALAELFANANKETDPVKRDEIGKNIKSANDELADLVDKIEPLQQLVTVEQENKEALKALRQPVGRQIDPSDDSAPGDPVARESFSDEVLASGIKSIHGLLSQGMESNGLKTAREGGRGFYNFRGELGELAIKTLIQTSGMTPLEERRPGIQLSAQEERTVADLMLEGTTSAQKVTYFEETTFTNAAAETAEAAAKPEAALAFTLREDNVRKIATWIPVTDEMMEDVPGFESYLRARLGFMVRQREELQLLRGDGTGQNILGVYNRTGVQTVTGYGLSTIDSILKGITEVQKDAFVEPTALVIHPNDWFEVRTSKDLEGNYLLGPATLDPMAARPWGLQVRVTTNALENTALVGAFNQAQVFRRSGIAIAISTENEDYFIYNKLAVRAEERLALAVYRPAAFCKVEAIVQGS